MPIRFLFAVASLVVAIPAHAALDGLPLTHQWSYVVPDFPALGEPWPSGPTSDTFELFVATVVDDPSSNPGAQFPWNDVSVTFYALADPHRTNLLFPSARIPEGLTLDAVVPDIAGVQYILDIRPKFDGQGILLDVNDSFVPFAYAPEPATMGLAALGLTMAGLWTRRRAR